MRPGLVSVGVAFLVVGGAAIASLYLAPGAPVHSEHDTASTVEVNPTIWALSSPLWGENGTDPTFTVHWQSTVPVRVALLTSPSSACGTGTCPQNSTSCPCSIANWSGQMSGSWTAVKSPSFPYYVRSLAVGAVAGVLTVYGLGSAITDEPAFTVQKLTGTFAGAAAILVGGVALFLGLFLRSNPYQPAAPVIPLSTEDIDELYGPGSEDEGPPTRTPPH